MGFDILTVGAPLVEVMRKDLDKDFNVPGEFLGPFPSGDTPIFINAAAKLGNRCGFIGVVGNDGFGKCVTDKLEGSGVDTSCMKCVDGVSTAVTFISYFRDGSRKFLYHLHNAAASLFCCDDIDDEYFQDVKWVHLTGFALSGSVCSREAVLKIIDIVPDSTLVSFDPNIRKEALGVEELRRVAAPVLERSSLVLPSINEAKEFMNAESDDEACRQLQARGKLVVQKLGKGGCRIYSDQGLIDVPPFEVEEVDPTGAGDTFCAGFLTGLLKGKPLYECGLIANAAGALSITKWGPMEGAPTMEEVERLINSVPHGEV
ncbi:MAG: sugar kinase [Spirochaetia bacterium]|jgi:sugar/nucleoside kinase (ribokinase family)